MTKREKIREGFKDFICSLAKCDKADACESCEKLELKPVCSIRHNADEYLAYLHSQGVGIKKDGELPNDAIYRPPKQEEIREGIAELEHEQWAYWTSYMLDNLTPENIERWREQIEIPYSELPEKEKRSDRNWADKSLNRLHSEDVVIKVDDGIKGTIFIEGYGYFTDKLSNAIASKAGYVAVEPLIKEALK